MQEHYRDGTTKMMNSEEWMNLFKTSDVGEATKKSLENPNVISTEVHKPGSVAEIGGRKYRLGEDGKWKRIKLRGKHGF